MGLWKRLLGTDDATVAHRFVLLWEQKIRPDLDAFLLSLNEEGKPLADGSNAIQVSEVRSMLRALLASADTRVTIRANEAMGSRPTESTVKKTRETVEMKTKS